MASRVVGPDFQITILSINVIDWLKKDTFVLKGRVYGGSNLVTRLKFSVMLLVSRTSKKLKR